MLSVFLYIKHHFGFIWKAIEYLNGFVFGLLYKNNIEEVLNEFIAKSHHPRYVYHRIRKEQIEKLEDFFKRQNHAHFRFFNPHEFDINTLKRLYNNPSFLMMGVSEGNKIIGYFFLRCFINKKCFIGRMVDHAYHKQGIATGMNEIMYETAWQNGFRCLTTISKQNQAIINLHKRESNTVILKELPSDYLLVEMKKPGLIKV